MTSPTASDIYRGACCAPGPFSEKKIGPVPSGPNRGLRTANASSASATTGRTRPATLGLRSAAPRLNPFQRKAMPTQRNQNEG